MSMSILNLCSAISRSIPIALHTLLSREKYRTVFKPRLKLLLLSNGSRRLSGNEFQAIGPPTAKARRLNVLCWNRGTVRKCQLADSQMLSTDDIRNWDAVVDQVLRRFIFKASVNRHTALRSGTLSQCSSSCCRRDRSTLQSTKLVA